MKTFFIASAAALSFGSVAAPAFAAPARVASIAAAAEMAAPESVPQPETRRYCVVETPTGSRIERRDCRTRADWLKKGFDPLAAK